MKINTILLITIVASSFSGAVADEGTLRGLKKALFGKGETSNNSSAGADDVSIEIVGDASTVTSGDAEVFGHALTDCLGFQADSLTWSVTETTDESRRRLGSYSWSGYSARRSKKNRRNLLTTPSDANECMVSGFCADNPTNTACVAGLTVESITIA